MYTKQDFRAEIRQNYQCYVTRIKLPFIYGDGIMRISVWHWEGQPWRFAVNSQPKLPRDDSGYATREEATKAALEAIGQLIAALQEITLKDLMPDLQPLALQPQ